MNKELMKKKSLWTKDFSCITTATILSIIGGEAMNLPISLLVFEETQSSFLAALVMVCGILPDVVLPILVAPFIDKGYKKKWIVGLDVLLALVYAGMGVWISCHEFQYGLYLIFILIVGTISVFYRTAYNAWYPDLIPVGMEEKGYAVSATIYPLITIIMSPVATFLFETIRMEQIFLSVSGLTLVSVMIESCIRESSQTATKSSENTSDGSEDGYTFRQYRQDIVEGFHYLKKEKGIRNIYTYMSITGGASEGINILTQSFYQTQPGLTVTMLGFLKSAEMLGRVLAGFFQYKIGIPPKKRYAFTKFVYTFYQFADAILLFLPYPGMLLNRFVCGGLGTTSATIRSAAVQSYLPGEMRARVNALFDAIFAVGGIAFQLVAGAMGQIMPYRTAILLISVFVFVWIYVLIVRPAEENRPVYEAVREEV